MPSSPKLPPYRHITDEADLKIQLASVKDKLVVISFFLIGNVVNDKVLAKLKVTAEKFKESIILLVVDVGKLGDIANSYEVSQIPWFIFSQNQVILKSFHSISNYKILNTVREIIGVPEVVKTYIHSEDDLNHRLATAGTKLVVITFFIPGDEPSDRINIDLDDIATRNAENVVFLKVDVDLCKDIAKKYHIEGVPTFVFVKNRQRIDEFTGHDSDRLHSLVNQYTPSTSKSKEKNINTPKMGSGISRNTPSNVQETLSSTMAPLNKKVTYKKNKKETK